MRAAGGAVAGDAEIRRFLVQRYGEFVLLRPRFSIANAAAWLVPFAIVVIGGVVLLARAGGGASPESPALSAEEEARLARLRDEASGPAAQGCGPSRRVLEKRLAEVPNLRAMAPRRTAVDIVAARDRRGLGATGNGICNYGVS